MFYKYLKLILFFTLFLQASQKAFNSLDNDIESPRQEIKNNHTISKSSTHSKLDITAYNAYKRTHEFQVQSKMEKTEQYTEMSGDDNPHWNTIEWSVTLKSLKEQTAKHAEFAAIAKGYHTDFIYIKLYFTLHDKNNKEVYRTSTIKRKMYTDKRSYIHHSSQYPKGLKYNSVKVAFNIDIEEETYANQLNKARKAKVQAIHQKRKAKVQAIRQKRNSLLSKVDHISNSALLQDGVLSVKFFYKNRSIDKQLYWENDVATITCRAYANAGDWLKPRRGSIVGQISDKRVTRAFQDIYIDIEKTRYERGILECNLNIHGRIFKVTNTFLM